MNNIVATLQRSKFTPLRVRKICGFCEKGFFVFPYRENKAKFCSRRCLAEWRKNNTLGEKSILWQGIKTNYPNEHKRLTKYFGHPPKCEFCGKRGGKDKNGKWNIEWALKKGKEYIFKRDNYLNLCRFCHKKYDWVDRSNRNIFGRFTKIHV